MTDAVTRTTVDPTVIAGIAAIAATQVPGVRLPVVGSSPSRLVGADPEPPVRSWCVEDGSVGVAVTVEVVTPGPGGRTVLAAAEAVRREVVAALAAMTRLHVSCCDVHVADLVEAPDVPPVEPSSAGPADRAPTVPGTAPLSFDELALAADAEASALLPDPPTPPIPLALPRPRSGEEPLALG